MIKFKYFFDLSGNPEEQINEWLKEHQDITVINVSTDQGRVSLLYDEPETTEAQLEFAKKVIQIAQEMHKEMGNTK